MTTIAQLPEDVAAAVTMASTGLGRDDLDALDMRALSLVQWTVDASRLADWRRNTDDQATRTAIDLILTPPEDGIFDL